MSDLIERLRRESFGRPPGNMLDEAADELERHQWISEWFADPHTAARFWVKANDTGYCWHWTGSTNSDGYGTVKVNGKSWLAHRAAYTLANRKEPEDCVLHHCDNAACVNPDHLFEGSQTDNMRDMDRKGRRFLGRTSKHKGVSWRNDSGKWRAQIRIDGRMVYLGSFDDEDKAAQRVQDALDASSVPLPPSRR